MSEELRVTVLKGEGLTNVEWLGDQDPYCKVKVMGATKKTNTQTDGGSTPEWNQVLTFKGSNLISAPVTLEVWDENTLMKDDLIGSTSFTVQDSLTSTIYEAAIVNEEGQPAGTILVQVEIRGADGKVIQAAAPPAPVAAAPPANGNIHQNMYAPPPPQAAAPPAAQPMNTGMLSENELFQIWNVLDNDRSGALTKPEMVKLMDAAGVPAHAHQTAFDQVDASNDGTVDYSEFTAFFSKAMNDPAMHHRIRCHILGGH